MWVNKDNLHEAYYVNGYRDEGHYQSFVKSMKSDKQYKMLAEKIIENQGESQIVTLVDYNEAS